ncbi:N-terminal nucleophile aminohydrolases (Ntn hydrolases) [Glarea lozoyensis ATCC 20868]|uniref:N-terminal nucleophile aminohydrolases (Ntn hydrolases) n=1 Tax=Glarea lozoyensis (strain ATCC 20868 / MF5171) TaxID=1116229 RepID=S3CNS6_GLAL2|nr:N-terminal nucleophile aminohydrolases (Ntn hydrolases) [Glarea lozoyensis ATCC 20868]EPE27375.1 N-terminal nucleophile aminohydrolases (Ntn hydrolases) [Glarea lozoyensis ATCC 20868]
MKTSHNSVMVAPLLLLQLLSLPTAVLAKTKPLIVNTWPFTDATYAAYKTLVSSPKSDPIDAVVAGCSKSEELQNDFTVGWGGSPDANGETTLDALVMQGSDQNTGAVLGLRGIKPATQVARDVLRLTKHSLLSGNLATDFAVSLGYKMEDLTSEHSRNQHEEWVEAGCVPNFWVDGRTCNGSAPTGKLSSRSPFNEHNHDTIGQIALQSDGKMAVGMSSNGATHKIPGRVGDAPIPGAGGYVDDKVGACVATGDGDIMMRYLPSFQGVDLMRRGSSPRGAAQAAIKKIAKVYPNFAGAVVCVHKSGKHGAAYQGFGWFSYSLQDSGNSVEDVKVISVEA